MSVKSTLSDSSGNLVSVSESMPSNNGGVERYLLTSNITETHATFKAIDGSVAATTIVTTPVSGAYLGITNILLSAEKKNTGSISITLTDDTNSILLFKALLTDNSAFINMPINGMWTGWTGARLEVTTVADFDYSVTVGYTKLDGGLPYTDWDARR